jgi:hypothetical protein
VGLTHCCVPFQPGCTSTRSSLVLSARLQVRSWRLHTLITPRHSSVLALLQSSTAHNSRSLRYLDNVCSEWVDLTVVAVRLARDHQVATRDSC